MTDDFTREGVEAYAHSRYRKPDQRWVHRRESAFIRSYLERSGGRKGLLLDAPCGYGRFISDLLETGSSTVGADLSFSMVREMLSRQSRRRGRLSGVVGDVVRGLPFRSDSFEGSICIRLFQHLHRQEERQTALKELARLSRDYIILSYYRWNPLHALQRRLRRRLRPQQASICMVSKTGFRRAVQRAGLEVVAEGSLLPLLHAQRFLLLRRSKPEVQPDPQSQT